MQQSEVDNKLLILHLVGFLSLHTLLTMHGHRNLKLVGLCSICKNLHGLSNVKIKCDLFLKVCMSCTWI